MSDHYFVIEKSIGVGGAPTYWGGHDVEDFGKLESALKLVDVGDATKVLLNLKPWPVGCRVAEVDHRARPAEPRDRAYRVFEDDGKWKATSYDGFTGFGLTPLKALEAVHDAEISHG